MRAIAGLRFLSSKSAVASIAVGACLGVMNVSAMAQGASSAGSAQSLSWQPGFIAHAQRMRRFQDQSAATQAAPQSDANQIYDNDANGIISTYRPDGPVLPADNPFFAPLGSNGRSCFTCHQPHNGWSISAADAQARFVASGGDDPMFRLVDGATCPTDPIKTDTQRQRAYKLLTTKGLFRIGLPFPAAPALQFKMAWMQDPYHCTSNPATGLTSATQGIMSVYRRPLPSTNLGFISAIMWDGREPTLTSQAVDAVLGHAQGDAAPTARQQRQIVAFESRLFTAQSRDTNAGELNALNATGGPAPLVKQAKKFFIGVNDPTGLNPNGTPFNPNVFNLYRPWQRAPRTDATDQQRLSVARGEKIFNTKQFNITDVGGINTPDAPVVVGACSACHDAPNAGSHSVAEFLNIGISNMGGFRSPHLDISGLPIYMLQCTDGPLAGEVFETSDPGRGLITGQCDDIGKFKVPTLRGLAARAPYFHNGSAATLSDVVTFYDKRFTIGLTARERRDLVNFLSTL